MPVVPVVVASCVGVPILGLFSLMTIGDVYVLTHLRDLDIPGSPVLTPPSAMDVLIQHAWRFALLIAGWLALVVTWLAGLKGYRRLTWIAATAACGVSVGWLALSVAATTHAR